MSNFKDNHISRVAIIGAAGRVGGAFTKALLATGKHTVTVITRQDSSSTPPDGVQVSKVDYDNQQSLIDALKGQEVLIITLAVTAPLDTQSKVISAAAKAGVPYIFHNTYGSDILKEEISREYIIGFAEQKVRKQIEDEGVSKWIGFCCSFWYEWSLPLGKDTFGFDIKNREVVFIDDGETVFDTSTWPQCGRAMAALLSLPISGDGITFDSFANNVVYINSFRLTQKQILASILRVTGDKQEDWKITHEPARERWEAGKAQMETGDRAGFVKLLYSRAMAKDGNAFFGDRLHNGALGLKEEELDELTKFCVDFANAGRNWYTE